MTYLVTGATGFIGSKLVEEILRRGHAVYYLARRRSDKLPSQASFHPWSVEEKPELNALSRIDVVIHLAGEPIAQRWTAEVKKRIYDSRIEGTRNLVSAMRGLQHKPFALISSSAIGYYGERGSDVLTEKEKPGTDFLAEVCKDWEREALRAREFGVRVVPIRTGTVLGHGGGALKEILPPFRMGIGGKFGDGKQWVSWIQIEDLVKLYLFAAEAVAINGPLNGSSVQPVTNAQFTETLAGVIHRPAFMPIPKFALKAIFGEMAEFLFTSLRVVPRAAEGAGFAFKYPTVEAALRASV
ncbi:MAG TPA: TIGR01777 family oxidoreductase [Bryobacteraceae bacterium]|nr:TIGR01777 family oxidoreductase [Bryobacteraceae bacterium]